MTPFESARPIELLLVEDDVGDVRLTQLCMKEAKVRNNLSVVNDGVEALRFLRREEEFAHASRPDLLLLDLNMPRMNGQEVLAKIKEDDELKTIPVVVLTSSEAEKDILQSYNLHANCYITKPVDLPQFMAVVRTIEDFWLCIVKLPTGPRTSSQAPALVTA